MVKDGNGIQRLLRVVHQSSLTIGTKLNSSSNAGRKRTTESTIQSWVKNCGQLNPTDIQSDQVNEIRKKVWQSLQDSATSDQSVGKPPTIPNYRTIKSIGAGGMGSVWLAEQTDPVVRKVAIKVVKSGFARLAKRLQTERQAMAMMSHPNIANIYDAGATDDGRPYFVMEYIAGANIVEYCAQNDLDLAKRLALFKQVCLAIHYSHTKGIIHRDIKPSNILVANDLANQANDSRSVFPCVKVIDFGLAMNSLQVDREKTAEHTVLGSAYWMSPEQAAGGNGNIDRRTDIYSLGALLYHLVTGSPPLDPDTFESSTDVEIFNAIRTAEIESPSKRTRRRLSTSDAPTGKQLHPLKPLRSGRDLDWVILKALEKDPEQRYSDAAKFASDVQNYLSGLSISANPRSPFYELKRWTSRHLQSILAVAMAACILVSALFVFRSPPIHKQPAILAHTLGGSNLQPVGSNAEANEKKFQTLYINALDRYSPFSEGYSAEDEDPEFLRDQLHELYETDISSESRLKAIFKIAFIFFSNNKFTEAHKIIGDSLAQVNSTDQSNYALQARCLRGQCEFELGRSEAGLLLIEEAIERFEDSNGSDAKTTPELRSEKATLASLQLRSGNYDRVIAICDSLSQSAVPGATSIDPAGLKCLWIQADLHAKTGDFKQAIKICQDATKLTCKKIPKEMLNFLFKKRLVDIYCASKQFGPSLEMADELVEFSNSRFGVDHAISIDLLKTAAICRFFATDEKKSALESLRDCLEMSTESLGANHALSLNITSDLANCYLDINQHLESITLLKPSASIGNRWQTFENPNAVKALAALGQAYLLTGNVADAYNTLAIAFESRRKIGTKPDPSTLQTLNSLIPALCFSMDRQEEAFAMLNTFIADCESNYGDNHSVTLSGKMQVGLLCYYCGKLEQSIQVYQDILEKQSTLAPAIQHRNALSMARAQLFAGKTQDAKIHLEKLQKDSNKLANFSPQIETMVKIFLARIQLDNNHPYEAQEILESEFSYSDPPTDCFRQSLMGECQFQLGEYEDAERNLTMAFNSYQSIPQTFPERRFCLPRITKCLQQLYSAKSDEQKAEIWQQKTEQVVRDVEQYRKKFSEIPVLKL